MSLLTFVALVSVFHLVQTVIFIISLLLSTHERRDLYNRLISENLGEYMRLTDRKKTTSKPCVNAHRKAIDAFHAKGTGLSREDEM